MCSEDADVGGVSPTPVDVGCKAVDEVSHGSDQIDSIDEPIYVGSAEPPTVYRQPPAADNTSELHPLMLLRAAEAGTDGPAVDIFLLTYSVRLLTFISHNRSCDYDWNNGQQLLSG